MKDIKLYFFGFIVIFVIIALLMFKRCTSDNPEAQPTVKTRIIYKTVRDTVIKTQFKFTTLPGKITTEYLPSKDYDSLKTQYETMRDDYLASNIYLDTIKLDSLGFIKIKDTIQKNKLKSRLVIQDYKLPTVIKEITLPAKPRTQVYIGGNLYGSKQELLIASPGILLKTKKDNIYQINAGVTFSGQLVIGAGVYYKIKLKN